MPRTTIHSLFLALRPPPEITQELWDEFDWLEAGDDRVERERMHVTLAPLGAWPRHPASIVTHARRVCDALIAPAFRIIFDDLIVGDRILLKPSEPVPALHRFHGILTAGLVEAGLMTRGAAAFRPHLTASYRTCSRGGGFLVPVSWVVRDFVLIESLVGQRKQIERGRWPLTG